MSKIAIVNGSTGCIDYLDNINDVHILRFKIMFGEDSYDDFTEMKADRFYSMLKADSSLHPKSSQPAVGEWLSKYVELRDLGYEEILVITMSSKLSGAYETALMAKNIYNQKGNCKIHIFDSRIAAMPEGYLVMEALKLRDQGKSVEQICHRLEYLVNNRLQLFVVDDLSLFVKNGRLSNIGGLVAKIAKIKPILQLDSKGYITTYEKRRTYSNSMNRMLELVFNKLDELGLKDINDFDILFCTSDKMEAYDYCYSEIEKKYPGFNSYAAPLTPVVGCHTGTGTIGITIYDLSKYKEQ